MNKLEKLLLPTILVVGLAAMLLGRAGTDAAIVVARTVGIVLVVLLVVGFVARTVVKLKRARRRQAELDAEMRRLAAEIAAESETADEKS